jgi:hypothetical protein
MQEGQVTHHEFMHLVIFEEAMKSLRHNQRAAVVIRAIARGIIGQPEFRVLYHPTVIGQPK